MKHSINIIGRVGKGIIIAVLFTACSEKFFSTPPLGTASQVQMQNPEGIDKLLIGAYSLLDGVGASTDGWTGRNEGRASAVTNWLIGDVASDDAYKGSTQSDLPEMNAFERNSILPTNNFVPDKWIALYDGISRSNEVLRTIANTEGLDPDFVSSKTAEARFLRGYYLFELRKIYYRVPIIDETVFDTRVPNDQEAWPFIEADLQFAADNLPVTQAEVGRANAWAAKAFLAKCYLFQQKFVEAKTLLDDIIANGVTSGGLKYGLNDCYYDNFNIATKNSKESVFAVQMSVNDGSGGPLNANYGEHLNFPLVGPGQCCGFFQPSQNLVNAFKTSADGLPLFDSFNDSDLKNDEGIRSSEPFEPDGETPLDPRLDHTVGRRGIAYLDWGPHGGETWVNPAGDGGPYSPKKRVYRKEEQGTQSTTTGWAGGPNANNYTVIRFADVLLWAAECEAELGDLEKARAYVNQVRNRAKNGCYVKKLDDNGADTDAPAANYHIEPYTASWPSKDYAMQAIRFERRLELAMEGHRFYDLVRWEVADQVLNSYFLTEKEKRTYLNGASFTRGKSEYLPVPQTEIINSSIGGIPTLTQNPGY
ncbi:Starch-binding associating with outer membrane [Parapedobacter luteus]|uniref:Starch-binding associating with outer membrane n=1 Tax=Parapedobacter luteus TaxID=623280 RepID=A0A1T5A5M4_9SPHI|nr:RagB/SusD family nutrient uptake outer membrane protein [Parapedobacter luteus]SKB30238.1 Starch-binding associating with outer membrane [Parapedobacter luteus]